MNQACRAAAKDAQFGQIAFHFPLHKVAQQHDDHVAAHRVPRLEGVDRALGWITGHEKTAGVADELGVEPPGARVNVHAALAVKSGAAKHAAPLAQQMHPGIPVKRRTIMQQQAEGSF